MLYFLIEMHHNEGENKVSATVSWIIDIMRPNLTKLKLKKNKVIIE